jgi:cell division protein FtsB
MEQTKMNKLKNYIAQYISLNNKIKEKQNELYELKDKKENLNEIIIHLIDENNLQDNIFKKKTLFNIKLLV